MKVQVNDEYSQLKKVVVASAAYYDPTSLVLNNETIRHYVEKENIPKKEIMLEEQKKFWDTLKENGIDILVADQVKDAKGQMFTRDLAFVIGDKFFISNMRKENRKPAIKGWHHIIDTIDKENIIKVPDDIYLEGGDILVDNKTIYVGISERTTTDGVNFLKSVLDDSYTIIPLKLKEKFLHLDVVFTIINSNLAIIYKEGLEEDSYKVLDKYQKINLTEEEQFELGTNVFAINPKTIIINSNHKRIKEEIEKRNIKTISLNMEETSKLGGAFRCVTCPLERK